MRLRESYCGAVAAGEEFNACMTASRSGWWPACWARCSQRISRLRTRNAPGICVSWPLGLPTKLPLNIAAIPRQMARGPSNCVKVPRRRPNALNRTPSVSETARAVLSRDAKKACALSVEARWMNNGLGKPGTLVACTTSCTSSRVKIQPRCLRKISRVGPVPTTSANLRDSKPWPTMLSASQTSWSISAIG